jgi:2-methylisocitrate lyase-like PEP mutase family enzyme
MKPTSRLRALLQQPGLMVAPGAYDALSARLIAQVGFPAAYMTGFGTAASMLAKPDVGLVTMSEMAARVSALTTAMGNVPLIADADTGYGSPINAQRTIYEYERAGAAALHIEDQSWPKKCGHLEGKQVIPLEEMVQKLRAIVDARQDPDFVIIARTDANSVFGLDEAIRRGQAYCDAGADMLLIEAPASLEEMQRIARTFEGIPLVLNWVESGRMPLPSLETAQQLGFKMVLFSVTLLLAVTQTLCNTLQTMKQGHTSTAFPANLTPFSEFTTLVGLPDIQKVDQQYR